MNGRHSRIDDVLAEPALGSRIARRLTIFLAFALVARWSFTFDQASSGPGTANWRARL